MNVDAIQALEPSTVTGLLLCGGAGTRMGGRDKGLVLLGARPLAQHVLDRLAPQVANRVLLNCNRNLPEYAAMGYPCVTDMPELSGQGPLAGIATGLAQMTTPYCVTCPCDTPWIPVDLVSRLWSAIRSRPSTIAVAHDGERLHPLHCLIPSPLQGDLLNYIRTGGRSVHGWLEIQQVVTVDFSPQARAFRNLNTQAEITAGAADLKETRS